jgi:hypothetical protein
MRFLEERAETLVLLDDSNAVRVLAKDPYTEAKYKMFAGKRIRYVATDGTHVAKIQENEGYAEFLCEFGGREVHVNDMVSMARAIIEHATNGNIGPLFRLLNWHSFLQELGLSVSSNSTRLDLTREGVLHVPSSVSAEVLERVTYHDGSRVAKLLFTLKDRNNWLYGMFRNHEYAVALVGIDETGQFWMHYLPPVYLDRAIIECEVWLAGGVAGDNLVF